MNAATACLLAFLRDEIRPLEVDYVATLLHDFGIAEDYLRDEEGNRIAIPPKPRHAWLRLMVETQERGLVRIENAMIEAVSEGTAPR